MKRSPHAPSPQENSHRGRDSAGGHQRSIGAGEVDPARAPVDPALWWARRPLAACRAVLFVQLAHVLPAIPTGSRPKGTSRLNASLAVWGCCQHLVRTLEDGGERTAALLLRKFGDARADAADAARDLACCFYDIGANKRRDACEVATCNGLDRGADRADPPSGRASRCARRPAPRTEAVGPYP